MSDFKDVAHKTVAELFDMVKEKQAEVDQLKAEIEGLKNPNLAQHTKKYREQCELFKSMSEVEKKAYSAGYDWACKVSQKQILTLIKDQEGVEDKLDDEIDNLKAQLNNMEACYIEKKKQVEACAALAAGWSAITWDKTTHWTEGYEEGCYHCSGQIEEALRGAND